MGFKREMIMSVKMDDFTPVDWEGYREETLGYVGIIDVEQAYKDIEYVKVRGDSIVAISYIRLTQKLQPIRSRQVAASVLAQALTITCGVVKFN